MRNIILVVALSIPTLAQAQRDLKNIPDPDPEVERKSFQVAPGFEVNLFASDPLLAKPIQMNFDAKGRLWVASSEVYPQIMPGQKANDKVLILEDKDGDGKADSTTVFADGLLIPTGVEPGDGGAYVANSTEVVFLKDTDGDGKADSRRVMLSGFGTEDTHHIIHTFRWGEDGFLYFNQSVYIHSHIETPWGPRRLNGGGIWQFRPESMQLEVFARGWWNSWGHHQDAWGASFATDGAGGEGINFVVPGAYYAAAPDAPRILAGLNPGSPKYCGLEVASGRHLPDDWQGNLLTNDFRANRVCRFIVSDDGSGFAAREQQELIKTTHGAFRPIDVKMGPDGAIYIADWYNPIIQHGEVDFRDPRRDHTRGRIWRVTAKGRPLVEKPKLDGATIPALLDALKSPEGYTRHFAKRVMKERGAKEVVPILAAWVKGLDAKSTNFEHDRLEALWTYQSLDVPEPELLAAVLNSPDPRGRAAASRIIPHWAGRVSDPIALLAARVEDEYPRTRLEAVRALAKIDDPRSIEVAMKALDRPIDRFLDYALWLTARETQSRWLPTLQAGKLDFGGDAKKLTFAMNAAGSPEVVGPLVESLRAGRVGDAYRDSTIRLIAALGGSKDMAALLDLAVDPTTGDGPRRVILDGLVAAWRSRKARPEGDLKRLGPLLKAKDEAVRSAAIRAVGAWKIEPLRDQLDIGSASPPVSAAIFDALAELGGEASLKVLDENARRLPPAACIPAIVAMAALDPARAADRAVTLMKVAKGVNSPNPADVSALMAGLLGRKGASSAMAEAIGKLTPGDLPRDTAKLAVRAARASGRDESPLIEALAHAGKIAAGPVALTDAEMRQAAADVMAKGDPARGELVFRRKDLQCLNCHAIAGAGGQVGPGLESVGASAQVDYLIDSLLQPSKAVKEGYHAVTVATDDGRVLTGIKLRDTDKELAIRDAEGRELTIPAKSVEEKKDAGSLMPVGLTETLTRDELLDLVRFLSELGKVGPYSLSKARYVRTWTAANADGHALAPNRPAYSRVDGVLPLDDLGERELVAFRIEVTTGGKVRLRLNSAEGVNSFYVDGVESTLTSTNELDLAPGVHSIGLDVRRVTRKEGLRVEIEDVPGSAAKAQPVVGK